MVNPVCFEVQDMGWSEEEVQFLKKNYKKMTYYKIAKVLGKSYSSVYMKAYRLQLKKRKKNYWSVEEDRFIIENYPRMSVREIADALGRSKTSVSSKIKELRKQGKINGRRYPMPKYLTTLVTVTATNESSTS